MVRLGRPVGAGKMQNKEERVVDLYFTSEKWKKSSLEVGKCKRRVGAR